MRTGVLIQARLGSTRLPRKILRPLGSQPTMLSYLYRRLFETMDDVELGFICPSGDLAEIREACPGLPLIGLNGLESDVLGRYHDAARILDLDVIVRVTSDCPLVYGGYVKSMILGFQGGGMSYLSSVYPERTVPKGFDVEIFDRHTLALASHCAEEASDREHVTPWIQRTVFRRGTWMSGLGPFTCDGQNFSVDTEEDYVFVKKLVDEGGDLTLEGVYKRFSSAWKEVS